MTSLRLKTLVTCPVEKSDGSPTSFVGLEDIGSGSGSLASEDLPEKAALDSIMYRPGDVLFSKLRPYLAKSFLARTLGSGTGELLVLRSRGDIEPRFLLYSTLSSPWLEWAETTSYGTKMPRTSWEAMSEYRLDLPSFDEQRRIADFLDVETARIDQISSLRSRQIQELEQRRWSLLQEIINRTPSDELPLRRMITSIIDGPFGSAFSSSDYTDDGAAVIRLGNIGFDEYRAGDQARIPMALFKEFCKHEVHEGDILIAGLGDARNHAGRACVAPDLGPAIVKGKCFRARVDTSRASPSFLTLLLSSPIGAAALEGRGSTRSMINLDVVKSAVLPIPRYADQVAISEMVGKSWKNALEAIRAFDRQLSVLAERRQALITAAVTRRITV